MTMTTAFETRPPSSFAPEPVHMGGDREPMKNRELDAT